MSNLTVAIDDEVLKRARLRATELGTSVNAMVREFLESFSGAGADRQRATQELLEMSEAATSERGGRRWTREELHDRPSLR